jgi:ectoine hydroxylase-related dioxygenase (phytanoyl-CoA dioxygenase family)
MAMTTMQHIEPFADSTGLLGDPQRLRQRGEEEGYLFFAKLLEPETVLDVRRQILEVCRSHDWLDVRAPLMDGVAREGHLLIESGDPRWKAFYCDVLKLRDFHALALHPTLIGMLEALFGESVLPHPRNICRVLFPHSATFSTPPHQDHYYIGGSEHTWTGWIPCGDCPVELGGLAIVPRSHRRGFLDVHEAEGAGGSAVDVGSDITWAGGEFLCGDVLIVHSLTIHQGRDNQTERLRLSCDFRYQPRCDTVRADSLLPHMGWLTWEDVYAGWETDDELRYYWTNWNLEVTRREN